MDVVMSPHLYFPPEVWAITLQNLREWKTQDELAYLWTTVRHVCRQLKEAVEEIFRTEHLPKTWLHLDTRFQLAKRQLNQRRKAPEQPCFDFEFRLHFDGFKPKFSERAVFSFRQAACRNLPSFKAPRVIENLFNEAGMDVEASTKSRLRTIEHFPGTFVIQVRAGLNDCAIRRLHIHKRNRELSIEWMDLFKSFFSGKMVADIKGRDALSNEPVADGCNLLQGNEFRSFNLQDLLGAPIPDAHKFLNEIKPSLRAIAEQDRHLWWQNRGRALDSHNQILSMRNPVQTWMRIVNSTTTTTKLSMHNCWLRHKADLKIRLTDEGDVDLASISNEEETEEIADTERRADSDEITLACDSCRERNGLCHSDGQNSCDFCVSNEIQCEWLLAFLSGHRRTPPSHIYPGGIPTGDHVLQDQRLLVQQQHRRRMLAAQMDPLTYAAPGPSDNYQDQLALLEHQNRSRLTMARQTMPMGSALQEIPTRFANPHYWPLNWPPVAMLPPLPPRLHARIAVIKGQHQLSRIFSMTRAG